MQSEREARRAKHGTTTPHTPPPPTPTTCSDAPKWLFRPLSIHSAQKSTIKQINLQTSSPKSDSHVQERSLFIYGSVHLPGCISEVLCCFILSQKHSSGQLLRALLKLNFIFFFISREHDCVCQTTKNINNRAIVKSMLLTTTFTASPPLQF